MSTRKPTPSCEARKAVRTVLRTGQHYLDALDDGRVVQTMPTGISPRALRLVPKHGWPGSHGALLVVSNFIDHTVTLHPLGEDDRLVGVVHLHDLRRARVV